MKYTDFIHMSVPGDGSCFFHSIAHILLFEKDITVNLKKRNTKARFLRRQCVNWLKNNLDYTIPQIGSTIRDEIEEEIRHCARNGCNNYSTVNEYLNYMKKSQSYAGQIEIYAMSYYLGRSIRVYMKNKGKFQSAALGYMIGLEADPMDDIHIYHNIGDNVEENQHHFEPLVPKIKEKKNKKKKKKTNRKKTNRKKTTRKKTTRKNTTRRKKIKKTRRMNKTRRRN